MVNLNKAITMVEKFLISEGLTEMDQLTTPAMRKEVEKYFVPLLHKNLGMWRELAEKNIQFE